MTAIAEKLFAYHIGIIVRDMEAAQSRWEKLFGPLEWFTWESSRPPRPFLNEPDESRLRVSYGRLPGQTIELIQPLAGLSTHSRFLRDRGEGVQHLGLWVPDLAAATRDAVDRGARITLASLCDDGTGVVRVQPSDDQHELLDLLAPASAAYVDAGLGIEIEFIGPLSYAAISERLGDAFDRLVPSPPWERR